MEIGFYHPTMGYWQTSNQPSDELLAAYPQGTTEVPLKPSGLHTFDGTGWVAPTQAELDTSLAISIRAERNGVLLEVDAYVSNPLRWAALDAGTQALWATYRQALLDVPQQEGFPHTHTFPEGP